MTVDNTTGYWTYALTAREKPHVLYGFSYQYYLQNIFLSDLTPNGTTPSANGGVVANINLNTCLPDDVECLVGGNHLARFRVAGSISGSFVSSNGSGYVFSYGKSLRTPIPVPLGNELTLVSKINDFWSNLFVDAVNQNLHPNYLVCQLNPGTGRLLIG